MVSKRFAHVRACITRPSIIIHCAREPLIGWTSTVSAAGAVAFPLQLGTSRIYPQKNTLTIDFIPADIVSNAIIMLTAYTGQAPKQPTFPIYHLASSGTNPCTLW